MYFISIIILKLKYNQYGQFDCKKNYKEIRLNHLVLNNRILRVIEDFLFFRDTVDKNISRCIIILTVLINLTMLV